MAPAPEDLFALARFVEAQVGVYDRVCAELSTGRKASHWMWFVFPQLSGLGRSPTAQFYAIHSRQQGAAYLAHAVLGPRLVACTRLVLAIQGRSVHDVFGSPDDLKFHSSMTLFDAIAGRQDVFASALERYFGGERDAATLALLDRSHG